MSSLILYGYNSEKIDKTYQNVVFLFVQFRANSKKLKKGLGHLVLFETLQEMPTGKGGGQK